MKAKKMSVLLDYTSTVHDTICDALRVFVTLYNLKNVKNIHGGVLLLVKWQASLKVTLSMGVFNVF